MPAIEFQNVVFAYGDRTILKNVNFVIEQEKFAAILGGSGSGKTTMMRLITGQLCPSSGKVLVNGEDLAQFSAQKMQAHRRNMGVLFQHGALFTDLSVEENIMFPMRELTKLPPEVMRDLAVLKLNAVGLHGVEKLMPSELSGGMARRVALARALIMDPPLLMLDEPTAGLDPDSSDAFCALLQSLHQELGLTVVMVTHDLDTLFALSSRVAVLAEQRVIIAAPVAEVLAFDHPFIRHFFLGERGLRAISDLPQLAHLAARLAHPAAPSSGA